MQAMQLQTPDGEGGRSHAISFCSSSMSTRLAQAQTVDVATGKRDPGSFTHNHTNTSDAKCATHQFSGHQMAVLPVSSAGTRCSSCGPHGEGLHAMRWPPGLTPMPSHPHL